MEAPYLEGVPYLSRAEEAIARRNRRARSAMPDIEISETDLESILFLEQLRGYIDTWRSGREVEPCPSRSRTVLIPLAASTYGLLERPTRNFNDFATIGQGPQRVSKATDTSIRSLVPPRPRDCQSVRLYPASPL